MPGERDFQTMPAPRRARKVLRVIAVLVIVFAALAAGLVAWLTTQSALDLAIARVERESGGRLRVSGATGTLLSTIRAAELRWDGPDATLVARDVAFDWSPASLFSRSLVIHGLGAQTLSMHLRASTEPAAMPAALVLPLEVLIERIGVGTLDWKAGDNSGIVTGLEFSFSATPREHRIRDFALVLERGRITGEATIGTAPPFATQARIAFRGAGEFARATADAELSGPLERLAARTEGRFGDARIAARAEVTPFAASPVATIDLEAQAVDLALIDARLPTTALAVKLEARPVEGGFAGKLRAANAIAGTLDSGRVPLRDLGADFVQRGEQVDFDKIVAAIPGGGQVRGRGTLRLAEGAPATWQLGIGDVDLSQLHAQLKATRLGGTLIANVDAHRQIVSGDIADRTLGMALSFAASVAQRQIDISRARLTAGGGALEGSGRVALDGTRPFSFTAQARQFDPARFGAFPPGALEGELRASGTLAPAWRADAEAKLLQGSKFAGLAASGSARATLSATTISAAVLDARLGATKLSARGAAGNPGDRLEFSVDTRNLAELAAFAPARLPRPLAGSLRIGGTLYADPHNPGGTVKLQGENLTLGSLAAGSVDAGFDLADQQGSMTQAAFAARRLSASLTARKLRIASTPLATARLAVDGTLGQHTLQVETTGDGYALDASARGGVRNDAVTGTPAWEGALETAALRGPVALRLNAPANVEVSRHRGRIGAAELMLAEGRIRLDEFAWDDARVTTRGKFDGMSVTNVARIAGVGLPLATDLTLAGEWSLAATPRLNGTLGLRRERGDVQGAADPESDSSETAFGIRTLALDARIRDDAIDGTATLRSVRAGDADATFSVAAGAVPGRIATDTPLAFKLDGKLASLAPLQPWLGTFAALSGRAEVDLVGSGTLAAPTFDGTLTGDALRFDSPRLGVHLNDGRLRARLARNVLTLDEFSIAGGDGRFEAQGTLARADAPQDSRILWKADRFRAVNRPDLRLVVGGEGVLAIAQRKVLLTGRLGVVDGRIDYRRPQGTTLGDDVVVKGRPRAAPAERSAPVPLALDLDVDLGERIVFEGEGLRTGLEGRIRVTTGADGTLLGHGTIRARNGTYYAFGQTLAIDRGQLIFDGPLDNPALDIVALRKNLAVEAGVALTGTVRVPQVRLTSDPMVPDGEILSWLVTGQAAGTGSGADTAALSAASAFLLGTSGKPIGTRIAQQFGLDDIAVRGSSNPGAATGSSPASTQVIAFGKRVSDRLNIVYEQGLTIANNALRLEYSLSRTLTLRAEAGVVSSVGINYRKSYD